MLRLSFEQLGLKLSALENADVVLRPDAVWTRRNQQIDNMVYTARNMACAGIPIFGYNWVPSHVWRTPPVVIRACAVATAFADSYAQQLPLTHGRRYSEEEMWANLEDWIKIITPIAGEEGIPVGIREEFVNTGYVDMYRAMHTYWEP